MKKVILIAIAGLGLIACKQNPKTEQSPTSSKHETLVKVEQVKLDNQNSELLQYSGIAEPIVSVPLSFQLPGKVATIKVEEGQDVRKNQTLATLDKTNNQNLFIAAQASEKQALDAYNRLKQVYDNGSLPEIKWEEVKSKVEQAKSSAAIAERNLNNCTLKSPINGIISKKNTEVGSTVTPGIPVFEIIDIKSLYIRISVPDNEINKLAIGDTASISFPAFGNTDYKGTIDKIAISANKISKTFEVKIKLDNQKQQLRPGIIGEVQIVKNIDQGFILVPSQAVLKDRNDQNYVYKVDQATNKAIKQIVSTTGYINNQLCISSGLQAGELIVTKGQHKLTDSAKVRFN